MRKLPVLPPMRCDPGCGECCGFAPCSEGEFRAIRRYVRAHGIAPKEQGVTCPLYLNGQCAVYEVRPAICRTFGYLGAGACARGYDVGGSEAEAVAILQASGPRSRSDVRYTHELLPGWTAARVQHTLRNLIALKEILGAVVP